MDKYSPSISMHNAQNDVQRQAKLYTSRAYTRLDEDGRRPSPSLLSVSMKLPSRNELATKRPSSAQVFPHTGSESAKETRGLFKQKRLPRDRGRQSESPNEWFQRIMRVRKLSPLDLCEKFSYGDARRNLLVSLDHVCEVLFDLDSKSKNDPVTEEMEDLLYQYATEQNGEIMVNIREALRSLDIWQTRSSTSTTHTNTQSCATNLISENKKLQNVVSSLQDTNVRLSRELKFAKSAISTIFGEEMTSVGNLPQTQANCKLAKDAILPAKEESTVTIEPSPKCGSISPRGLHIVNDHEQELIEVASKLQFTGVERLEHLLSTGDADSTGFVNVQQLCRLLADHFKLKVTEARLIEMCMGMKFDSKAQLDYKEFVNVLMDILIYALPTIRDSGKKTSLYRLDKYLESGFLPGREKARQVLDALCSKYDLLGNQCLSAADLVRIFQEELVKHHALKLPFPLKKHEIIQLAQPFTQHRADNSSSEGVFAYPELLNAILGPLSVSVTTNPEQLNRALEWSFWREIYMALCSGNVRMEKKVRTQLEKIMTKLDPGVSFTISLEHFKRIFDQHLGPKDIKVLRTALAVPEVDACGSRLRYDVLLSLVFGFPELNDEAFLKSISKKLSHMQIRIESFFDKFINVRGLSHKLSLQDFHDVFMIPVEKNSLTLIETLFLFASAASSWNGQIDVEALTIFLETNCRLRNRGKDKNLIAQAACCDDADDIERVKKIIADCCCKYNLHQKLDKVGCKTQGWISQNDVIKELGKMLHQMGVIDVGQKDLHNFVSNIARHSSRISQNATTFCLQNVIHSDAIFDALFDWDTMVSRMRLTHSLVEVKKVFEKFDRGRDGTIRTEDWDKVFRSISGQEQDLHRWEVRVLERKFPGQFHKHTIDYARLVVFLLDYEQRQARNVLQSRVLNHFQQLLHHEKLGAEIEKLFRAIDVDNKGYFDAADLKTYMTRVFARESEYELHGDSSIALWNSTDAVASIMRLFAKLDLKDIRDYSSTDNYDSQNAVTLQSFRNIARSLRGGNYQYLAFGPYNENDTTQMVFEPYGNAASPVRKYRTVSSLRSLEMTILNITRKFVDQEGNFRPARAFRYLTLTSTQCAHTSRHTPPTSPLRRSTLSNLSFRAARKNQEDQDVLTLASLTPSSLKKLLFYRHQIKTSKRLVSQFFLHIGSPSKHFLDMLHFAKWAVPLPCKLYEKVRHLIKQMFVKGKGGGGRMGMERFLAQLQRQLQHSPHYEGTEDAPVQFVSMSLLLSKLHQLNISLHKQELFMLLRHFGMDDDLERVDYASFLHHMYELEDNESFFA